MRRIWLPQHARCLRAPNPTARRHSSNVPGPLEARRRSSKRKYVGAVSPHVDHAANDAGLLLSLKPGGYREHEAARYPVSAELVEGGTLPSWLTAALNSLELQPKASQETVDEPQATSSKWQDGLTSCQSLQDIQLLASQYSISLQDPEFSHLAFQRICGLQPEFAIIIEFLSERGVNPPAAKNLSYLMENLHNIFEIKQKSNMWRWKASVGLSDWLKQEACSGSLAEVELRELLRWGSFAGFTQPLGLPAFRARIIHHLGVGLCKSTIRPIHQLQPATIRCLVRALASKPYMAAREVHRGLASKVIRKICRGDRKRITTLTRLFVRTYLNRTRSVTHFQRAFHDLLSIAGRFGDETISAALDYASSKKATNPLYHEWFKYCLAQPMILEFIPRDVWERYVAELGHSTPEQAGKTRPSFFATYVKDLEPKAACRHILDTWLLPMAMSLFQPNVKISGSMCSSADKLKCIAMKFMHQSTPNPTKIPHIGLLEFAHELSPALASELAEHLLNAFNITPTPATLYHIAQHCQRLKIPISETTAENIINRLALHQPSQALSLFVNDLRLRLDHCLPLIAGVIASPSIPTEVLLPLLSRNGYFRGHQAKLQPTVRNLALVHSMATMLSQSRCSSTSQLALISRVLDMFENLPAVYTDSMRRALLCTEVISPLKRGERLGPSARAKILAHIANTEGAYVCKKLEILLASWEARHGRERGYEVE